MELNHLEIRVSALFLYPKMEANNFEMMEKGISPVMAKKSPSLMGRNATQVTKNEALDSKGEMQQPTWLD